MPLNEEQVSRLNQQLKARFYELRQEISGELRESDAAPYIELAGRVHDAGEASVAELVKGLELASVDRHIDEIRAIDEALLRIANRTYGLCLDCRSPIPFERLAAQPTAVRCQTCQERWEKTGSTGPHPGPTL
jgi:RNA polymerase-binding protein DksA